MDYGDLLEKILRVLRNQQTQNPFSISSDRNRLLIDIDAIATQVASLQVDNPLGASANSDRAATKGVDLTVGSRQKHQGMSWRPKGSKALCLLKVAELNGEWQQLWFPAQSA